MPTASSSSKGESNPQRRHVSTEFPIMASPECALPNHVPTHSQASLPPGLPNFSQLPRIHAATASPDLTPSLLVLTRLCGCCRRRRYSAELLSVHLLVRTSWAGAREGPLFVRCSNESVHLCCA